MFLDKDALSNSLKNKYLLVVVGKLQDEDRSIIKHTLNLYDKSKNYVGESHIEGSFYKDMSRGLKSLYGIKENTSVMFFKNGFLEHKRQGDEVLFNKRSNINDVMHNIIDIHLPMYSRLGK